MTNFLKFMVFLILAMVSFVALRALFDGQLFGAVILGIIIGGLYFYRLFQRKALRTTVEGVEMDERAPVIYLRSFSQEELDDSLKEKIRDAFRGEPIPGVANPTREQEQHNFAKYMNQIGPFIAIGRPGEALPFPGAKKVYVGDDEWQDVVSKWIDKAQTVVLEPRGAGQGMSWEITYVVAKVNPKRVLIILPRVPGDYKPVRDYLCKFFPQPLPEEVPRGIRLLTFKPEWEPFPISGLYPFFKQNGFDEPKDIDPHF
jgi:hypothetical protein